MATTFCGQSGHPYAFELVNTESPWARETGLAIFAARDDFGWRVIRVFELDGRPDNMRAICAHREAQRYGASRVFLSRVTLPEDRRAAVQDLEAGLSPVCDYAGLALAA